MRPITHCLNRQLQVIGLKVMELDKLTQYVLKLLPDTLRTCCTVGSFQQGRLLIHISDHAHATELRYLLPQLRDALRKDVNLYQLITIEIRILDGIKKIDAIHTTPQQLSAQTQSIIMHLSTYCSYAPLKQALAKLASTVK